MRDIITGGGGTERCRRAPTRSASATCTPASWTTDAIERPRRAARCSTSWPAIDAAPTPAALAAVLGELQRTGVGGGVGLYVDTDSKNSTRYLVHLTQSGLGLPDESYYRDEQHAEILAAYPEHIARMFALVYGGTTGDYRRPPTGSWRWRPNSPPRTGTWSSAATPT